MNNINSVLKNVCKVITDERNIKPCLHVPLKSPFMRAAPLIFSTLCVDMAGFPLGLEKLQNLEKWEGIFQSGKSQGIFNRLEKSGKITQNTGKVREFQKNFIVIF